MEDGLYQKYKISKVDGSEIDTNADYFVLRLDSDLNARKAMLLYANNIEEENPKLARELRERINYYEMGSPSVFEVRANKEMLTEIQKPGLTKEYLEECKNIHNQFKR